jgi:uncharacterized protein YhaN
MEEERDRLTEELALISPGIGRAKARIEQLLQDAGASDEEQFRHRVRIQEERLRLEADKRQAEALLDAAIGPGRLEWLGAELEGRSRDERLADMQTLRGKLEETKREADERRERRGRLHAELEQLEGNGGQGDAVQRLAEHTAQFAEQANRWATLAVCASLFKKARDVYERERQPGVLQRASEHFAQMTGGRYSRIVAPLGEKRLAAVTPAGDHLDSSLLSRRTAEQLYLAMRLALAEEYASKAPLPLIMDDILVNFDRERLIRACTVLGQVAAQHQIVLFTCHPHIVEAIGQAVPGCGSVRLEESNV